MFKAMWSVVGSITFFLSVRTLCAADDYVLNEHQHFILNGVATILNTCLPAAMVLLTENAYPILTGDNGGVSRVHVAATEFGDGRIVAFSHTSFYINGLPDRIANDNVKLFINSLNWVQKNAGRKIGVYAEKQTENVLKEHGFEIVVLTTNDIGNSTLLEQFDTVVCSVKGTDTGLMNLQSFVRNGGGLLLGATGWTADRDDLQSYWGNVILQGTGIFYIRTASYGSKVCDGSCFDTSPERLKDTNAYLVWQDLVHFDWNEMMSRERLTQMMEVLFDRLKFGPGNENLSDDVAAEAQRILEHIPTVIPTLTAPVVQENERTFIIYHRYWIMLLNLIGRSDYIHSHPAAESFPGTSTSRMIYTRNRKRLQEIVEIDEVINWYSTGLYAQPGEEIEIRVLSDNSSLSDLDVQIGIHSDDIEKADEWVRCPYIVFRTEIKKGAATMANPFGGLIFIRSSARQHISSKFSVDGGIRSPSYALGQTKLGEWKNIRNRPAPWGELIGKSLIISVQSSLLKQLDDPEEVIETWDLIMDTIADLAVIPHDRDSPSRFVSDIQIGGGWMHSGYPIMFHLESQSHIINMTQIKENPWVLWGFLHELGHNHQKQDWNFKGTGEVTCNLFALYVLHTLFDCPTNSTNSYSDANVAKRLKTYTENGKQFSQWQSNYDLAFDTYVQLQEAYGWSAYKTVFANYQLLTQEERPTNDEERIDMWMVMFSRAVQENMAEFFISWGFPVSSEAKALVENLPPSNLRIPDVDIQIDI